MSAQPNRDWWQRFQALANKTPKAKRSEEVAVPKPSLLDVIGMDVCAPDDDRLVRVENLGGALPLDVFYAREERVFVLTKSLLAVRDSLHLFHTELIFEQRGIAGREVWICPAVRPTCFACLDHVMNE